jgi:hypothetical protein
MNNYDDEVQINAQSYRPLVLMILLTAVFFYGVWVWFKNGMVW